MKTTYAGMKAQVLAVIGLMAFGLAFAGCDEKKTVAPGPPGGAAKSEAVLYACPMHPEVTDTKASKCPKCGMDLTRKN